MRSRSLNESFRTPAASLRGIKIHERPLGNVMAQHERLIKRRILLDRFLNFLHLPTKPFQAGKLLDANETQCPVENRVKRLERQSQVVVEKWSFRVMGRGLWRTHGLCHER